MIQQKKANGCVIQVYADDTANVSLFKMLKIKQPAGTLILTYFEN